MFYFDGGIGRVGHVVCTVGDDGSGVGVVGCSVYGGIGRVGRVIYNVGEDGSGSGVGVVGCSVYGNIGRVGRVIYNVGDDGSGVGVIHCIISTPSLTPSKKLYNFEWVVSVD